MMVVSLCWPSMISSWPASFLKVTMGPRKYSSAALSKASQSSLGNAKENRSSHSVAHSSSPQA